MRRNEVGLAKFRNGSPRGTERSTQRTAEGADATGGRLVQDCAETRAHRCIGTLARRPRLVHRLRSVRPDDRLDLRHRLLADVLADIIEHAPFRDILHQLLRRGPGRLDGTRVGRVRIPLAEPGQAIALQTRQAGVEVYRERERKSLRVEGVHQPDPGGVAAMHRHDPFHSGLVIEPFRDEFSQLYGVRLATIEIGGRVRRYSHPGEHWRSGSLNIGGEAVQRSGGARHRPTLRAAHQHLEPVALMPGQAGLVPRAPNAEEVHSDRATTMSGPPHRIDGADLGRRAILERAHHDGEVDGSRRLALFGRVVVRVGLVNGALQVPDDRERVEGGIVIGALDECVHRGIGGEPGDARRRRLSRPEQPSERPVSERALQALDARRCWLGGRCAAPRRSGPPSVTGIRTLGPRVRPFDHSSVRHLGRGCRKHAPMSGHRCPIGRIVDGWVSVRTLRNELR